MARSGKSLMMRFLDLVEVVGNRLPHPFWLFCYLILIVVGLSAILGGAGVSVTTPETQVLKSERDGEKVGGRRFSVGEDFDGLTVELEGASHSSRLSNLYVELNQDGERLADRRIDRKELVALRVDRSSFPMLEAGSDYELRIVNRSQELPMRSLVSKAGLEWLVLNFVDNFASFPPLGLVLVMLMGVAIAEGAGLIPTVMRWVTLRVPPAFIIPALFAVAACGNIGSDAGIVVVPPLAAVIFKQMGRSPIVGLLVGYVGATAGFTANLLPAGTDVLAMSLTNAATGGDPEINVLANWYFMIASVPFLALVGTFVTLRYVLPRFEDENSSGAELKIEPLTAVEKRATLYALLAIAALASVWMLTIVPTGGWLRNPDPNPDLIWRSSFFKGLVPILFTLFTIGGIVYGRVAGTIKKADDILGFMTGAMKRMGGYIVLILVIAQFTEMFKFARLDQLIAVQGAELLRSLGMEEFPVPFFIAFIFIIALANLFIGSASAKWAVFAPIFVPMFMALGFHPAFTQLLYRLGDSITNCVSPLYPFFPVLLGWIAEHDKEKAKVGTVLSYLIPYANFLLIGWVIMLVGWYLLGLALGPNSPVMLAN